MSRTIQPPNFHNIIINFKSEAVKIGNGKVIDWTTFAVFIIGILVSSQAAIMGYIPVEYVPLAGIIFGALSQVGSLLRNGQENDENYQNGYSSASDDTVKYE